MAWLGLYSLVDYGLSDGCVKRVLLYAFLFVEIDGWLLSRKTKVKVMYGYLKE